jgi:SAM-dependent methyltransferase
VSKIEEVRDFYERLPYPAPLTSLDKHRGLYKNPDRRRATFHLMWPTEQPRRNQEILIAGCGTSQAASYALREPDARITAIDISDTSLRHTRDLQRKYNLENLRLHQLPIERVREMGRTFDLVVCTGVLHHLPDPDQGLCALRDVLRPSGAMRVMVYARYGRVGIYMMQEYCRLLGITASAKDLRDLGATIEASGRIRKLSPAFWSLALPLCRGGGGSGLASSPLLAERVRQATLCSLASRVEIPCRRDAQWSRPSEHLGLSASGDWRVERGG